MEYCLGDADGSATMGTADPNTDVDGDGSMDAAGLDFDGDGLLDDAMADPDRRPPSLVRGLTGPPRPTKMASPRAGVAERQTPRT